jgi:hypothetical protein
MSRALFLQTAGEFPTGSYVPKEQQGHCRGSEGKNAPERKLARAAREPSVDRHV